MRGIILYESAVIKKNSQYINVRYNSIPLITSESVFITLKGFIFAKILIKSQRNCWADSTFSLRFNKYLGFKKGQDSYINRLCGSF